MISKLSFHQLFVKWIIEDKNQDINFKVPNKLIRTKIVRLQVEGSWHEIQVNDEGGIGALFVGLKTLAGLPNAVLTLWNSSGDAGAKEAGTIQCEVTLNEYIVVVEMHDQILRGSGKAFVRAFNLLFLKQHIANLAQPQAATA